MIKEVFMGCVVSHQHHPHPLCRLREGVKDVVRYTQLVPSNYDFVPGASVYRKGFLENPIRLLYPLVLSFSSHLTLPHSERESTLGPCTGRLLRSSTVFLDYTCINLISRVDHGTGRVSYQS
jgi:hypothetical protein